MMTTEEELKANLNKILEIESNYFDMEELSNHQKATIVKKIVNVIKNNGNNDNDTK